MPMLAVNSQIAVLLAVGSMAADGGGSTLYPPVRSATTW